jgi:hypothetical protein
MLSWTACSRSADITPLAPSAVTQVAAAAIDDNSTLKIDAPRDLAPNAQAVGQQPALTFTNPERSFAPIGLAYEIDVQNAGGQTVYSRVIGESPGSSGHAIEMALAVGETFWWRVRGRLGDEAGPWSHFAEIHIVGVAGSGPAPMPPPGGALPFPVPGECGPFGPGDRTGCVLVMASISPWWGVCQAGSGVGCHRFTRSVAAALAMHDSRWGVISKNPGEQQCTWDGCGPGDGSGYGEDIVAYHMGNGDWIGWDIVLGAGAPGAGAHWSPVSGRRAGNDWRPVPPFP